MIFCASAGPRAGTASTAPLLPLPSSATNAAALGLAKSMFAATSGGSPACDKSMSRRPAASIGSGIAWATSLVPFPSSRSTERSATVAEQEGARRGRREQLRRADPRGCRPGPGSSAAPWPPAAVAPASSAHETRPMTADILRSTRSRRTHGHPWCREDNARVSGALTLSGAFLRTQRALATVPHARDANATAPISGIVLCAARGAGSGAIGCGGPRRWTCGSPRIPMRAPASTRPMREMRPADSGDSATAPAATAAPAAGGTGGTGGDRRHRRRRRHHRKRGRRRGHRRRHRRRRRGRHQLNDDPPRTKGWTKTPF